MKISLRMQINTNLFYHRIKRVPDASNMASFPLNDENEKKILMNRVSNPLARGMGKLSKITKAQRLFRRDRLLVLILLLIMILPSMGTGTFLSNGIDKENTTRYFLIDEQGNKHELLIKDNRIVGMKPVRQQNGHQNDQVFLKNSISDENGEESVPSWKIYSSDLEKEALKGDNFQIDTRESLQRTLSTVDKDGNKISDVLERKIASILNEKESLPFKETSSTLTPSGNVGSNQSITAANNNDTVKIIVMTRSPQFRGDLQAFLSLGGILTHVWNGTTDVINGFSGYLPVMAFSSFARQLSSEVQLVEEDLPAVRFSDVATHLTMVRTYIWDTLGYTGDPNMSVAVLDTGIDDSHVAFSPGYGNLDWSKKIIGWHDSTADGSTAPEDFGGHGSHVAGIIAANEYNDTYSNGRIKSTWSLSYNPGGAASGFFSYYLWINRTGVIDINYIWNIPTGSQGSGTELRLHDPSGTMVAQDTSGANNMSVSYTVSSASQFGYWRVALGVSWTGTGGDLYVAGVNRYPYPEPTDGHARFSGVAPNVKLVGVKIFDNTGAGGSAEVVDAFNWVKNNKELYHITIASGSFGFSGTVASVDQAASNLVNSGVTVIIAAGNDGQGKNSIFSPGQVDGVITVAASDDFDSITTYSSEGPGATSNTTKPDIAAPGGESTQGGILQVDSNDIDADGKMTDVQLNDLTNIQGTSMATPHVSGVAALLIQAMGGYSAWSYGSATMPFKVKQLLLMTANEIYLDDRGGKDLVEGYGRINPYAAIEAVLYSYTVGSTASAYLSNERFQRKVWARQVSLTSTNVYDFKLEVPEGADYDLFLYHPNPNQYGEPVLVAKSTNFEEGGAEYLSYQPSTSGTYYLVVKTAFPNQGKGNFTLTSRVVPSTAAPSVNIVTPSLNSRVSGTFTIQVGASDVDLSAVYVKIGNDGWIATTYNSGSGYYELVYNSTALPDANHTIFAKAVDAQGNIAYDVTPFYTDNWNQPILLVDDDKGASHESYYMRALRRLGFYRGIGFDYWNHQSSGTPPTSTLQKYQLVMWYTSDDFSTTLDATDQTNLQAYLNNGGYLWIAGQDIGYDIGTTGFYQNYLHAVYDADNANGRYVSGVTGTLFEGAVYYIGGGAGAGNNAYPDDVSANTGASIIFYYDNNANLGGGISYSGSHKVIYLAFNWEAMDDEVDRVDSLNKSITWFNLDDPPNAISISSPNNGSYVSPSLSLAYSASDDVGISEYRIFRDGTYITTTTATSVTLNGQPSGWHVYRIAAFDSKQQAKATVVTVYVDANPPSITLNSPINGTTHLSGTVIDLDVTDAESGVSQVLYNWDGGVNQSLSSPYDVSLPLSDGQHVLRVYARDAAGNWASKRYVFTTDDTMPSIVLNSPSNDTVQRGGTTIDLDVTDANDISQALYNWDGAANQSLSSPYDVLLPSGDGQHVLRVYARDAAGNWASKRYVFTTDDTMPSIALVTPANGSVQPSGTTIDLDVTDANGVSQAVYNWDGAANQSLSSPYDVSLPSGDGQHVLRVYANDIVGNWASKRYVFTTDDTAPIITLNSPSNNTVNPSGTTIDLDVTDATSVDTVWYNWDGGTNLTLTSPYDVQLPVGDGQHVLNIFANDTLGNSAYKRYVFSTDDTAPTITLIDPANGSIVPGGSTIDLEVNDANALNQVLYNWDGGVNQSLSSPYDVPLPQNEGQHVLLVYAQDAAGNWNSTRYVFTASNAGPTITLNSPLNESIHQSGTIIDLDITDSDGVSYALYSWDGGVNQSLSSPYDVPLPSGDGQHVLRVYAQDVAGNWAFRRYTFIANNAIPKIILNSPKNGSILPSSTTIDLNVTDEDGLSRVWYNWDNGVNFTISFPYVVPLPVGEGQHVLTVYANDTLGYFASKRYVFTTDDTMPSITLVTPLNSSVQRGGTIIDLDVTDANGISQALYNWDGGVNQSFSSSHDVLLPSGDGQHVLRVYARDAAGNWASKRYVFTADDTAPSIVLISPTNGSILSPGATIDLEINDVNGVSEVLYSWNATINRSLSYPHDLSLPSADGLYILLVHARDVAGNWNSARYVFIVYNQLPVITLVNPTNESILRSGSIIDLDITDSDGVSRVWYNWDGGVNQTLSFPHQVSLPVGDGPHVLWVHANDTLGALATRMFVFFTDDTVPTIDLLGPQVDLAFQSGTLVELSVTDANEVVQILYSWDGAENRSASSTHFNTSLPSGDGQHVLVVHARDVAGNWGSWQFMFITDDTAPLIELISPANDTLQLGGNLVDLEITDANNISQVFYSWDDGQNMTLSIPYDLQLPLDEGQHVLNVGARDVAGNWARQRFVFTVVNDSSPTEPTSTTGPPETSTTTSDTSISESTTPPPSTSTGETTGVNTTNLLGNAASPVPIDDVVAWILVVTIMVSLAMGGTFIFRRYRRS